MSIVSTDKNYGYSDMRLDLVQLNYKYPFLNIQIIGNSVLEKNLYVIKLGKGKKKVFYSASIHANEWITSLVMMKFIEDYCESYVNNSKLYGYSVRDLFNNSSIYIMPMINPDGVDLVTGNSNPLSYGYLNAKSIAAKYPSIPFPNGWKANINGVDLNLQFPALWEKAKEIKFSQGFTGPAPRDFVGYTPLSEPESKSIYYFTLWHNFNLVLTYHSQGEVLYWQFQNYNPPNSLVIGKKFANVSGYKLEDTPYESSFAGYKDWFIQTYNKPGYTIEVGLGENPLPLSQFNKIYNDNLGILVLGATL